MSIKTLLISIVLFVAGIMQTSAQVQSGTTNGILAWWLPFGVTNSGTSFLDYSGNNNTAYFTNSPIWTNSVNGGVSNAVYVTGVSNTGGYAGTSYIHTLTNNFSICTWFKAGIQQPGTQSGTRPLITISTAAGGVNNQLIVGVNGPVTGGGVGANVFFYSGNGTLTSLAITNNAWYHYALTIGSGRVYTEYVNGLAVITGTNGPLPAGITGATLAGDFRTASRRFAGAMSDIRVYNRQLSVTDIQNIMKEAQPASTINIGQSFSSFSRLRSPTSLRSGLVEYWDFESSTGVFSNRINQATNYLTSYFNGVQQPGKTGVYSYNGDPSGAQFVNGWSVGTINQSNNLSSFTIALWLKVNALVWNGNGIFDYGDGDAGSPAGGVSIAVSSSPLANSFGLGVQFNTNGTAVQDTKYTAPGSVATGVWQHWVVTRTNGAYAFYTNGVFYGGTLYDSAGNATNNTSLVSASTAPFICTTDNGSTLGVSLGPWILASVGATASGYNCNAQIDDLGLWNRGLSATEVTNLYNGGNSLRFEDL